jgi:hypothetical protein
MNDTPINYRFQITKPGNMTSREAVIALGWNHWRTLRAYIIKNNLKPIYVWTRQGKVTATVSIVQKPVKLCSLCNQKRVARGLCWKHYQQARRAEK